MAFTYDPTTARGRIRLLIGDTDTAVTANQIFTDAEIDAFLAVENNEVYPAAASACQSISASTARSAIAYRLMDRAIDMDRRDVPKHYRELAKQYRERGYEPSEEIDSMAFDIGPFGQDRSEYVGDMF